MQKLLLRPLFFLLTIVLLCLFGWLGYRLISSTASAGPPSAHDFTSLQRDLRAAGVSVVPDAQWRGSADFLSPAHVDGMRVNGERVAVFEYASADAAHVEAQRMQDPHGPLALADFFSMPHFYQHGNIIVEYVGTNTHIITLLKQVLGQPFLVE